MTRKTEPSAHEGDRIAKVMARAGLCSRREAEAWIAAGRVTVNGATLASPAFNVKPSDRVMVDGRPLPTRERTRLFRYHKPRGLITTDRDPEGRPTIYQKLPAELPRLVSVGRLDFNSEGLLLLTNDGGLKHVLELPETGWLRRYRVRARGEVTQADLDRLKGGVTVEGVAYGPVDAKLDRVQGANVWLTVGIREGKNREVRKVLSSLGLAVNRLIRVSYGPFQLMGLEPGAIEEVKTRTLREQLGERLARAAGCDFEAPVRATETKADAHIARPRASMRKKSEGRRQREQAPSSSPARTSVSSSPPPGREKGRGKRGRSPSRRQGGPRGSYHGGRKH
jgi:23S rRNA pseudouridine2605 synthase